MSELLRMANELVEDADESECEGYRCHLRSDFEKVIKGYQDLLRQIVNIFDQGQFYKATTVSNIEFSIEGDDLVNQLLVTIAEVKDAIPGEKVHE